MSSSLSRLPVAPNTLGKAGGVLVALLLFAVLAVLLGLGDVFGLVFFLLYAAVALGLAAVVLWLLWRFVVAAERIADAQQRMAGGEGRDRSTESPRLDRRTGRNRGGDRPEGGGGSDGDRRSE
jgi:CBS domain containing-hemolysin-like protein